MHYLTLIIILKGPNGEACKVATQLKFTTINNEVEYETIIVGMSMAREMGVKSLEVRSDS
jgi:ribonuclease HI